jgi:hypothetical protein
MQGEGTHLLQAQLLLPGRLLGRLVSAQRLQLLQEAGLQLLHRVRLLLDRLRCRRLLLLLGRSQCRRQLSCDAAVQAGPEHPPVSFHSCQPLVRGLQAHARA